MVISLFTSSPQAYTSVESISGESVQQEVDPGEDVRGDSQQMPCNESSGAAAACMSSWVVGFGRVQPGRRLEASYSSGQ